MKVTVFGTGFSGSAIVRELASRGHQVTAVSRSGGADLPSSVTWVSGSVNDPELVTAVSAGADALVAALPARNLAHDLELLCSAAQTTGARLGVVGGSSLVPLEPGGPREADAPGYPQERMPLVNAHQAALDELIASPSMLDWFYLVPAAEFGLPVEGRRTGAYRSSTTVQVRDASGRSHIGVEDYAIACADQLERPSVHRGWVAVGY